MSYATIVRLSQPLPTDRLPALYWDQRDARGRWAGVSTRCAESHCGGQMLVEPPTDCVEGRRVCANCARESHRIVARGLSREITRGPRVPWGDQRRRTGF